MEALFKSFGGKAHKFKKTGIYNQVKVSMLTKQLQEEKRKRLENRDVEIEELKKQLQDEKENALIQAKTAESYKKKFDLDFN